MQLCHPDLANEFPPLRTDDVVAHGLPVQLTSFVGRGAQIREVCQLLADNRLVTPLIYVFVLLNKPRVPVRYFIVPGSELIDHPEKFGKWLGDRKFPGIP